MSAFLFLVNAGFCALNVVCYVEAHNPLNLFAAVVSGLTALWVAVNA